MTELKRVLMERDNLTESEADDLIEETCREIEAGNWEALQTVCGLEDDYLFDLPLL